MGVCKAFPRLIGRVAIVRGIQRLRGKVLCVLGSEQRLCPSQRDHQKDMASEILLLWSWEDWVTRQEGSWADRELLWQCSSNRVNPRDSRRPRICRRRGRSGTGGRGKGSSAAGRLAIQQQPFEWSMLPRGPVEIEGRDVWLLRLQAGFGKNGVGRCCSSSSVLSFEGSAGPSLLSVEGGQSRRKRVLLTSSACQPRW